MNDYRENLEIDLKDLFKTILVRWKIVVIALLVGSLLGAGVKYYKLNQSVKSSSQQSTSKEPQDPNETLKSKLSDNEIEEVNRGVDLYYSYSKQYDDYDNYKKISTFYNLDANSVNVATVTYLISDYNNNNNNNGFIGVPSREENIDSSLLITNSENLGNIVELYNACLINEDINTKIAEIVESNPEYSHELYTLSQLGNNSILSITVCADNSHNCEEIVKLIKANVSKIYKEISLVIPHTIEYVSEEYDIRTNSNVMARQNDISNKQNAVRIAMMSIPDKFTSEQKAYYKALLNMETYAEENKDVQAIVVSPKNAISKKAILKFAIIGAVAGVFVIVMLISFFYVMSPFLRTVEDLKVCFGLPLIATIDNKDSKSKDSQLALVCSGLSAIMKNNGANELLLTGTAKDDLYMAIVKSLSEYCKERNIKITPISNILKDSDSLDKASSSEGLVLVEVVGDSSYEDISRELEICKNYGIKVAGVIAVK